MPVAAVTGGARGIGRATAAALAQAGYAVAIGDLEASASGQAAAQIGGKTVGLELNVADSGSFERFLDVTESQLGPLEVLVNNAGIMHLSDFLEEDDASMVRMFAVNVFGVARGMKLAVPRMLRRGRGHVVNIASMTARVGYAGAASYSATKHAVLGLTEAIRAELRESPIHFSVILPGTVNTELALGLPKRQMERWLEPEELANAIVEVLRNPRFVVFVPPFLGTLDKLAAVFPRPWSEAIARALKADNTLADADKLARADYELSAARSNPVIG